MQPGLSTHVFLQQRLHAGLLDAILRGLAPHGVPVIEVFAAHHHFEYTDRSIVRDLASWFRDAGVRPTLHQPIYSDHQWSRHVSATLNLIDPEKSRRIDAMDEVKRALETAEQIPFTALTLHLGLKDDAWNLRALENSLTAIEHLKAFAQPLGVTILLENLQNEVTTPEHLLEILNIGHFDNVGIALDAGHAHLANTYTIDAAFELLKPRIATVQLHDNSGLRDEHGWPILETPSEDSDGGQPKKQDSENVTKPSTIDWAAINTHLSALPSKTPAILEISHDLNETVESVMRKASACFSHQSRLAEQLQSV